MSSRRREPRWVKPFLRALERTGQVRSAAKDAGVDYSSAYARSRAHPEFGEAMEAARLAFADRRKAEEQAAIEAVVREPSITSFAGAPPAPDPSGEELVVAGGKVRRAGSGRWSPVKEQLFFDELAATANLSMAAEAVGISTNAIQARRLRHPLFAAKFDAVVRSAGAAIDLYLIEETRRSFDPEADLDTGDVKPKVTIDQAIKISQLNARKRGEERDPFAEEAPPVYEEEVKSILDGLVAKLRRLRAREMPKMIAEGWSFDEGHDQMVPPGWVRADGSGSES